jgi:hypothetical protein
MTETQNTPQFGVLTLDRAAVSRPSYFFKRISINYPQPNFSTCSSSVADPSLSPRSRGQRHRTRVWWVAGKERKKELVLSISKLIMGKGKGGDMETKKIREGIGVFE